MLTISRAVWLRGERESMLYRPEDGKMCCLGIYLESLGVSKESMKGCDTPGHYYGDRKAGRPKTPAWLLRYDGMIRPYASTLAMRLMEVNDNPDYTDEEREWLIEDGFGYVGIQVRFIE